MRHTFLVNFSREKFDNGQNTIKSKKHGIKIANVEALRAPNKAIKSSILGTQIANKNDKTTKNERNKL